MNSTALILGPVICKNQLYDFSVSCYSGPSLIRTSEGVQISEMVGFVKGMYEYDYISEGLSHQGYYYNTKLHNYIRVIYPWSHVSMVFGLHSFL